MSLETQVVLRGDIYLFTINSPHGTLLGVITFALKDTLKCQLLTVRLCKYAVFLINCFFLNDQKTWPNTFRCFKVYKIASCCFIPKVMCNDKKGIFFQFLFLIEKRVLLLFLPLFLLAFLYLISSSDPLPLCFPSENMRPPRETTKHNKAGYNKSRKKPYTEVESGNPRAGKIV